MTQTPAVNPLPNSDHEYYQGDRIEYTGKTEYKYGAKWYEVTFVEGHRMGKTSHTRRAPKTS